jgi:hypothetical protein
MSLYIYNEIADYWNTKDFIPNYLITSYMSRNRFQELHIRMRIYRENIKGLYNKVNSTLS